MTTVISVLTPCAGQGHFVAEIPNFLHDQQVLPRKVEVRAVWMDYRSIPPLEHEIQALVRSLARAGFNVLHPETVYNGYSLYPSAYLTQDIRWKGLDVLRIIISEAHKLGVEVHPWIRVFRVGHEGDRGGILRVHPEWVAVDRCGHELSDTGGLWLCPSSQPARKFLLRVIEEIVTKYEADGIHLDYIRYGSPEFCYNDSCRLKFKFEYGIDPLDIEPFTKPFRDWYLWRENLINSFVREVSETVKRVRPRAKLSAAVVPVLDEARLNYLQNWEYWIANRWIDFIEPMTYTSKIGYFQSLISRVDNVVANRALVVPGINVAGQPFEQILQQIHAARSQPTLGVSLFSTSYLTREYLEQLHKTGFSQEAIVPFRSPVDGTKQLIESVYDKLDHRCVADSKIIDEISADLETARRLLAFHSYHTQVVDYIPPTPPPMVIPDEIVPVPEASVPEWEKAEIAVDGQLTEPCWQQATVISLLYTKEGDEACKKTTVYVLSDREALYMAFVCEEPKVKLLREQIGEADGPVFFDDSVEIFLDPTGSLKAYYHLALNTKNVKYDARGKSASVDLSWESAVVVGKNKWIAEIAIPFAQLVPKDCRPKLWRVNFCRNRILNMPPSESQYFCWSPTYGSYHTPIRFGFLRFEGGRK
jgi:uncharacterized lipoprotein YddW (UPF0748 family)